MVHLFKTYLIKVRTSLSYTVNTIAADDLATPGARTSAAMVLTKFV